MDEQTTEQPDTVPSRHTLLHLIRAYNRREITLDEWLQRTREWAEAVIAQHRKPERAPAEPD